MMNEKTTKRAWPHSVPALFEYGRLLAEQTAAGLRRLTSGRSSPASNRAQCSPPDHGRTAAGTSQQAMDDGAPPG